jgi:hypothetical protein
LETFTDPDLYGRSVKKAASGHECEFDRRRTKFCFGCGMLPFLSSMGMSKERHELPFGVSGPMAELARSRHC